MVPERQECGEVGIFLSKDVATRQLLSRQDNRGRSYKAGEVFWKRSKMVEIAVEIHMFMPTEVVEICRGGDLPTETLTSDSKDPFTRRNNQYSETLAHCQVATQPFSKRITNISSCHNSPTNFLKGYIGFSSDPLS